MALITDGRFSGATRGFCIGHVGPEAAVGGPIALVQDGDIIADRAETGRIDLEVDEEELQRRRAAFTPPRNFYQSGVLWKYAQEVGSARKGAVTHPGAKQEIVSYADREMRRGTLGLFVAAGLMSGVPGFASAATSLANTPAADASALAERTAHEGHAGGLEAIQTAAQQGNIQAQLDLARIYTEGRLVQRDEPRACEIYGSVADSHSQIDRSDPAARLIADAFRSWALCYVKGAPAPGWEKNLGRAAVLFYQAGVMFEDPESLYELSKLFLKGQGVAEKSAACRALPVQRRAQALRAGPGHARVADVGRQGAEASGRQWPCADQAGARQRSSRRQGLDRQPVRRGAHHRQ